MADREQVSRTALAWLLLAQVIILLPHSVHAPVWLWAVWLWVVVWRWQIFRGAWGFPSLVLRVGMMATLGGGLLLSYGVKFDMTAMVGLLLAGFVLKLLELRGRRDLLVTIYLGYFVAATQFLFHRGPLAGLYGSLSLVALTATLVAANQSLLSHRFWPSFSQAGVLLAQAVPLMLVLFLLIPRTGALWSVPSDERAAMTGISDSMSPGDIGELAQSNALAFRVTFDEGAIPPPEDRYWRGLVFSYFDGRQWRPSRRQEAAELAHWDRASTAQWRQLLDPVGTPVSYSVMLEPTGQRWLFALPAPTDWDESLGIGHEMRLLRREPVQQRMAYQVTSHTDYRFQVGGLADWERQQELQLPQDFNPQTRARAREWAREAASEPVLIDRLLAHYRAHFRYTLRPQTLGRNTVDEFLWQNQEGFCEHFASSFVFFMRAAGIPARVVVGYLGATQNPVEDYWTVRQRDAHAWAEVWLRGRGWVRFDPTAAVAPERVERGLDSSLSSTDAQMLERGFGANLAPVQRLQLRWDAFNYQWHRLVLGYDQDQQSQFLEDWLGGDELWRIALAVMSAGAMLVLGLLLAILWRQRPQYAYPADRQWARVERKLKRAGWTRQPGETPRSLALRLGEDSPSLGRDLLHIAQLYELVSYADNRSALAGLRAHASGFRPPKWPASSPNE